MRRGSSGMSPAKAGTYLDNKCSNENILWPSGPSLLWKGDLEGEALKDWSGGGHHGVINGAVIQRGPWGDCVYFDGVNDTVAVDGVPLVWDEITIVYLINSQSLPVQWDGMGNIAVDENNYFNLTSRGLAVRPYIIIGGEAFSYAFDTLVNRGYWELWVFTMSKSGNFKRLYINGVLVYEGSNYPGKDLATYSFVLGSKMKMLIGAHAFYERVLSDSEIYDLMVQYFPFRRGDLILFDGDSLVGRSDGDECFPAQMMGTRPGRWYNHGTDGDKVYTDMINDGAEIDSLQVDDGENILVYLAGRNDLANGRTVQETYDALAAYGAARQAAGWIVVVCTIPNRTGSTTNQDVNVLLKAGYTGFADVLVDVAAITELADPTDTDYFNVDGIHLITAGYTLVAALVGAAVDQLFHGGARY